MNPLVIDPARRHEPVHMVERPGRYPVKQGRHGTRRWNVWYVGYHCPTCGATNSRPCNPFKGRKVAPPVCDGVTYHNGRPVKRPARLKPVTGPPAAPREDRPAPPTPGSTA